MNTNLIMLALIITAAIVFGVFRPKNARAQSTRDAQVIARLMKAGSDVKKPHQIDFFFYFPTQAAAEKVASKLSVMGVRTEVEHAAKGPKWEVQGQKTMIPDEADLVRLRSEFDALAATENGEYDGWGTEVVK